MGPLDDVVGQTRQVMPRSSWHCTLLCARLRDLNFNTGAWRIFNPSVTFRSDWSKLNPSIKSLRHL